MYSETLTKIPRAPIEEMFDETKNRTYGKNGTNAATRWVNIDIISLKYEIHYFVLDQGSGV